MAYENNNSKVALMKFLLKLVSLVLWNKKTTKWHFKSQLNENWHFVLKYWLKYFLQALNYTAVFIAHSQRRQSSTKPCTCTRKQSTKPLHELLKLQSTSEGWQKSCLWTPVPDFPHWTTTLLYSALKNTSYSVLDFINLLQSPFTSHFCLLCSLQQHSHLFIVWCKVYQKSIVKQDGKWQATILYSVCRRDRAFFL